MGIVLVAFFAARAAGDRALTMHVNFETDQLIGQSREPVELIISVSILESYVLALNIAERTELSQDSPRAQNRDPD